MVNVPGICDNDIGAMIDLIMRSKGLTAIALSADLYEELGFGKASSAQAYINNVRNGRIYGTTGSRTIYREGGNLLNNRLAKLLQALRVKKEDPLIARIEDFDPRFDYYSP